MFFPLGVVGEFHTDAQAVVEQQFFAAVLVTTLTAEASQEHHGEFQTLGCVDGHQPHAALAQSVAAAQIHTLLLQAIQMTDKSGQTAETALLKTTGDAIQLVQVGHTLTATATGGKHRLHVQFPIHRLQQSIGGQRHRQGAQTAQMGEHQTAPSRQIGQVGVVLFGHLLYRHVQRQIFTISHAQQRQIVGGEAEQGR